MIESGQKKRVQAAVLGADVSKSRSPAIHEAAFRALGIEGEYTRQSIEPRRFAALVRQLRAYGYRYLNVTIPHKIRAAKLADESGPEVLVSRAANTLIFQGGRIRAENTDGAGLIAALADLGFKPRNKTVVVVGAGGAAAGGVEALTRLGANVRLLPRRLQAGEQLRTRLPLPQRDRVRVLSWEEHLETEIEGAVALVSAVPADAWISAERRFGLRALRRDSVVLEMAYGGLSPLGKAARKRTELYDDGLRMLAYQARRAITLALKRTPPIAPLLEAAKRAL